MLFMVLKSKGIKQALLFFIFNSKYALVIVVYAVNFDRL